MPEKPEIKPGMKVFDGYHHVEGIVVAVGAYNIDRFVVKIRGDRGKTYWTKYTGFLHPIEGEQVRVIETIRRCFWDRVNAILAPVNSLLMLFYLAKWKGWL